MLARGAWRGLVFVALAGLALGCSDQDPVSPGRGPEPPGIALAVAATMGETISPRLSNTDIVPAPVGTYPEWTLVEIKATGLLNRYFSDAPIWGAQVGKPFGQWDAGGVQAGGSSCIGNVWIAFDSPGFVGFCDNPSTPLRSDWRAVRTVRGEGRVGWVSGPHRTDGTCDTPATPPCFTYLGDHTVTITPFPAELVLEASSRAVEPGVNVTFSASVTPDTIENVGVPFKVAEWRWLPDAGGEGAVLTQCANQMLCNFAPTVSGTMRATGYANGAEDVATVHVTVFPCLTGDSLLDDPLLRSGLRASWLLSGADNSDPTGRMETSGAINCDPATGVCEIVLFEPGPNDTWCSNSFAGKPVDATTVLIWHILPFRPDDAIDPIPANPKCPKISGGRPAKMGPSWPDDYQAGGGRLHVVVDGEFVWVIHPPPQGAVPTPLNSTFVPRNGVHGLCDPLASPIV